MLFSICPIAIYLAPVKSILVLAIFVVVLPGAGTVIVIVECVGLSNRFVIPELPEAVTILNTIFETDDTPLVVAGIPLHDAHILTTDSPPDSCLIVPLVELVEDAASKVTDGVKVNDSGGGPSANALLDKMVINATRK